MRYQSNIEHPPSPTMLKEIINYVEETGELFAAKRRGRVLAGERLGTLHKTGYIHVSIFGRIYKAHRVAWAIKTGEWPKGDIDHFNGIKSDNRFFNLRDVSHSLNQQNQRRAHSGNATGLMGVTKSKYKFIASIRIGKKTKYIGSFDTPEAANEAYLLEKRKMHQGCTI